MKFVAPMILAFLFAAGTGRAATLPPVGEEDLAIVTTKLFDNLLQVHIERQHGRHERQKFAQAKRVVQDHLNAYVRCRVAGFKQGCGALTHVPTMREMCAALAELYPARLPYADLRLGDKNGLFSEGELAALQLAEDKSFGMQYFLALYFEMYGLPEAWLQGRCG